MVSRIEAFRPFYRDGGVTLTGGEPLAQPEFAAELLRRLKQKGFHTAVDTAGSIPLNRCREAVDLADLLLLDIKALDPELCRTVPVRMAVGPWLCWTIARRRASLFGCAMCWYRAIR